MITWTTRDRAPLITESVAAFLRGKLPELAVKYGSRVIELGIVNDHVHVLVRLPTKIDIPRLVQGLKGASTRLVNRDGVASPARPLYWASGYDLRSVGLNGLKQARAYLQAQPYHHEDKALRK